MTSVFSKIIQGELPAYKINEDSGFLAFLDINPVVEGHALVVPKQEIDYLFDLEDSVLSEMMLFAKKTAHAIEKAIDCKRVGVLVIGTEVPHAHIHLIPFNNESEVDIKNPKLTFSPNEFEAVAAKIRSYL
ncbi:MAG: HIT family protein [Bacteroidia bacterium]|nr:MAG: HIT family protein [Bacteroidia bacterium]